MDILIIFAEFTMIVVNFALAVVEDLSLLWQFRWCKENRTVIS